MANTVLERLLNDKGVDQLWNNVCRYVNSRTAALGTVTLDHNVVLLWENASPTSNFPAQTINIDYSDYDFLFVVGDVVGSNNRFTATWIPATSGGNAYLNYIGIDYYAMSRQITLIDEGVSFTSGYMVLLTNGATYQEWDNRAIPIAIYGIKFSKGALSTVNGINYELSEADYDELMGMLGE